VKDFWNSLTAFNLPGPTFDWAGGTLTLPFWLAAPLLAVFVVFLVAALGRSGLFRTIGALVVVAVVALAGWLGLSFNERSAARERIEARRDLDRRAMELTQQAVAPGSPLACLDGSLSDQLEASCEKALFNSAEAAAAAISYAHAKFVLYVDGVEQSRLDPDYETKVAALRIPLESDRYGVVAQMLSLRYGCSPTQCDAISVFPDPERLQTNLRERPFDTYVARNSTNWPAKSAAAATGLSAAPTPVATATPGASPNSAPTSGATRDYPSAASIPPVNIMSPEPAAGSAANAPSSAAAGPPVPPRRPAPARWSAQSPPPARSAPAEPSQQPH
jgi:hypothetical protein